jgi:hypothetical protein
MNLAEDNLDWKKELRDVGDFLRHEFRREAGYKCGLILEAALKDIYGHVLRRANIPVRDELLAIEKRIAAEAHKPSYQQFQLGSLVCLYREAKVFDHVKSALGVTPREAKRIDLASMTDIRNNCSHSGYPAPSLNQLNIFYCQLKVLLAEFGYIESDALENNEGGHSSVFKIAEAVPVAEIELKPSGRFTFRDWLLQALIWVPAVLIIILIARFLANMRSRILAGVIMAISIIIVVAMGIWFFKPGRRSTAGNKGGRHILKAPGQFVRVMVDARIGWRRTGIQITSQIPYRFLATGTIQHSGFSGSHDADGNPQPFSNRSRLKGAEDFNVGSLIGKIGQHGKPFLVGAGGNEDSRFFSESGELLLAINDWPRFDNKGIFKLTITRLANEVADADKGL